MGTSTRMFWGSIIAFGLCGCLTGDDVDEDDPVATIASATTVPVNPVADATVRAAYPTTNYGATATLATYLGGATAQKQAFLRFAVPAGTYAGAKLRLYVTAGSTDAADVYAIS